MASDGTDVPATPDVKKSKTSKAKSAATKKKTAPSHPSFVQMITETIVSLKVRTGSSQFAVTKFIEEKYGKSLPPNFKRLLLNRLKKLVAAQKLVKVKNSFKLPPAAPATAPKKKTMPAAAGKPKLKRVAAAKAQAKVAAKPKAKPPAAKPKAKVAKKASKTTPLKAKKVVPVKKPKSVKKTPAKKMGKK